MIQLSEFLDLARSEGTEAARKAEAETRTHIAYGLTDQELAEHGLAASQSMAVRGALLADFAMRLGASRSEQKLIEREYRQAMRGHFDQIPDRKRGGTA